MSTTVVFGLSGPSCSGKTTVALNLLKLFPHIVIIHQDDFYKPDSQIPVNESLGIQDWDCPAAFDMQAIVGRIRKLRKQIQGMVTLDNATEVQDAQLHFASQWANPPEDVDKMVDPIVMESLKQMILHSLQIDSLEKIPFYIILVDGILLFHDNDTGAIHPRAELDTGILIYAQYDTLKQRRNERTGYTTKEGIWADPPGYFDSIVWPNFVKYHKQFIQAHPQILERGANASSSNSVNNINSHVAVCSSDTPVADILRASIHILLDRWRAQRS